MQVRYRALACTLALIVAARGSYANDENLVPAEIPREFRGSFEWSTGEAPYKLTLRISKLAVKNGRIRFEGIHHYTPGDYELKIEGQIDPRKRTLVIREVEPSTDKTETEGSFQGMIATDLQSIEAIWTTRATGRRGTLKLKAHKPEPES